MWHCALAVAGGRLALHVTHCWDFFSSVKEKKSIFVLLIENFVNWELEFDISYSCSVQIVYLDKPQNIEQPFACLFAAQTPFTWEVLAFCHSQEASKSSCVYGPGEDSVCGCADLSSCRFQAVVSAAPLGSSVYLFQIAVWSFQRRLWEAEACEVTKITGLNGSGIPGKKNSGEELIF